jgi:hypothetical protein
MGGPKAHEVLFSFEKVLEAAAQAFQPVRIAEAGETPALPNFS